MQVYSILKNLFETLSHLLFQCSFALFFLFIFSCLVCFLCAFTQYIKFVYLVVNTGFWGCIQISIQHHNSWWYWKVLELLILKEYSLPCNLCTSHFASTVSWIFWYDIVGYWSMWPLDHASQTWSHKLFWFSSRGSLLRFAYLVLSLRAANMLEIDATCSSFSFSENRVKSPFPNLISPAYLFVFCREKTCLLLEQQAR